MLTLMIYLNDHLAAAAGALELARRARRNNRGTPLGEYLGRLVDEVAMDKAALEQVMELLQVRRSRLKQAAAWALEKVGRLKLNGHLLRYSELSRLEELEALALGVDGKVGLWRALRQVTAQQPGLRGVDLDDLIRRGEEQREELESWRLLAAAAAFPPRLQPAGA